MTSTQAELDARLMARALEEGKRGHTAPNPHVGAVVAHGERIVGTGHHERAGAPHAEVVALRAAGAEARGATLYCTLEPCNHHGRTPPCTDAILAAGIARVVVSVRDPKAHGAVRGVERLRAAGITVDLGVLEEDGAELVADFAMLSNQGRPLTVLKAAATLDGRIATRTGSSKWITGEPARAAGHALRDASDAILVGVGTVLADDPRLDVRLVSGRDPIRVILDTHLRTPPRAHVITHESSAPTWILHAPGATGGERLAREGVELVPCALDAAGRLDLRAVLAELGRRDLCRVLVEGGARVHGALIAAGLADRAVFFLAPLVLADRDARSLAERDDAPDTVAGATRLEKLRVSTVGADVRIDARFVGAPY
ncbi:MAG: bifunctional diaminohydroxyphosphoribosylaminopyrimidine deaminase/5-amino-6-(5-phosphoribosylamino)uracil reductase RibD [Sandaracinus sp.]